MNYTASLHSPLRKPTIASPGNRKKYMMLETSYSHGDLYAWRQRYLAGAFGKINYSEGEYFHYFGTPIASYNPKTGNVD